MLDTTAADSWMQLYLQAWASDDPKAIAATFAEDAQYFTAPFRDPYDGIDAITQWWIGQKNSTIPWGFEYEVIAREADQWVIQAITTYPDGLEEPGTAEVYHNIFLVTLDDDGRASEFIEYWMLAK